MQNTKNENDGKTYVNFRSGIKHPKLSWVIMMLGHYGIAHRLYHTLQGAMLQVEQGTIELATGILNQELATFDAVVSNNEDGPTLRVTVTIDDLPDDHTFFEEQLAGHVMIGGEVPKIVPVPAELPAIEEDDTEDEADPDDLDDWGFDDIEDDDDDDDPTQEELTETKQQIEEIVANRDAIEVEAKVTDAVAVDPKPVKTKKDKKRREPTDPDFQEAAPPVDNLAAPVDGTEFLTADETLAHEDVTYPKVKKPIRMYDVDSSTISAFGAKRLAHDPLIVTLYVRFKSGATVYRYNPTPTADWNTLLNLAIRRKNGVQEASTGSFFHHAVKVKAEEGTLNCQRLTDDGWVNVLPKAERTKQIKQR